MSMNPVDLGAAAPRTTRGVPYPQETVTPNSQQVRAETAAADAVIPTEGLDVGMTTVTSGAGVPIVFCREVDGLGGCWVSPPCVQYGFNVDASDNVDIGYTVVVGQGEYPAIPEADVYYGDVLFNSLPAFTLVQEYQALPYNVIVQTIVDPSATEAVPVTNGGGGSFEDVTVLGCYAELTAPAAWDRQVHIFMRNGVRVDRYIEGTAGSSNNFADLVRYLLESSGEVQSGLIDHESLETAAQFLNASGFKFSGVLSGTSGLGEYIERTAPLFLCVATRNQGQIGILPTLPLADDYTISTAFVSPSQTYTMADIVQGSFRIQYVPAVERKPFQAVMAWRDPLIPGKTTQTTVNYSGRAVSGPYEQYDLTAFCASEEQAIKVGRYILAQRLYVGHSIQFQLLPAATAPSIGDLIRVVRDVMPNGAPDRREAFIYRVTRLAFSVDGVISVTALHHPRTPEGTSQIAKEIEASPTLEAQTPEDWEGLPPYDAQIPPAVVGGPDYISATGGFIYYQGDFKYHVFGLQGILSSVFPSLDTEPSDPHLWFYEWTGKKTYKKLINDGVFAFSQFNGNRPWFVGSSSTSYVQQTISSLYSQQKAPLGVALSLKQFRILSAPIGGTMDVLIVGGGGMAYSPTFGCFQPGGGGEVLERTIAATPGFYCMHAGSTGFAFGSLTGTGASAVRTYLGQLGPDSVEFENTTGFNDSVISYGPDANTAGPNAFPIASATNLILLARGGYNAYTGTTPTFVESGASGNGFSRGTSVSTAYGGAGGAGGAGANAVSSTVAGDGGAGVFSSIFGTPIEFGAGGGGGVGDATVPTPTGGRTLLTPGSGGGGLNGLDTSIGTVTATGCNGRAGIVVIKYRYQN